MVSFYAAESPSHVKALHGYLGNGQGICVCVCPSISNRFSLVFWTLNTHLPWTQSVWSCTLRFQMLYLPNGVVVAKESLPSERDSA